MTNRRHHSQHTPTIVLKHERETRGISRGDGYAAKLLRFVDVLSSHNGVRIVTVWHDRRCACLKTGRPLDCRCDPRLEIGAELDQQAASPSSQDGTHMPSKEKDVFDE